MKITQEMGRACLRELLEADVQRGATEAIEELVGGEGSAWPQMSPEEFNTALAMCAAIAGVKPEDVE